MKNAALQSVIVQCRYSFGNDNPLGLVGSDLGRYIIQMVNKTDIDDAAAAFLDLWQKQITLSSQKPEESVKALFNKAEHISEHLKMQFETEGADDAGQD